MAKKSQISGVYKIVNKITGDQYIGQSRDVPDRWRKHRWAWQAAKPNRTSSKLVDEAIREHGIENFAFELIEQCPPFTAYLIAREQHYVGTMRSEYNFVRFEISAEVREMLQIFHGWSPDAHPTKVQQLLLDTAERALLLEHQKMMTEAATVANTGKPCAESTKQRIREAHASSPKRQALYERQRGSKRTPEQRQRFSEAQRASEKVTAARQAQRGKMRGNNPSGHYGIIWDKSRNKWQVRILAKQYGRFDTVEEAVVRRDQVMPAIAF